MAQLPKSSLVFTVRRREAELVAPSKPTPREYKQLSDIDDQDTLRFQTPFIQFYRRNDDLKLRERDPVKVIRQALADALVLYYPFAGRLREGAGRKLIVDCTGEGVLFIEADADVEFTQFEDALHPPFPWMEELLYDIPGSAGILNSPLILIQVTRLLCGGFIFALRLNHTMSDGSGLVQFMTAISEIARGAHAPSVKPVWQRELFNARNPPHVTFPHHEYNFVGDTKNETIDSNNINMTHNTFFFGPTEVSTLCRLIPPQLQACSTLNVVMACVWRCRTIALQLNPHAEVRFLLNVSTRARFNPPLPAGYYGNAFVFPAVLTTAGELSQRSLGYALELVMKPKSYVTQDYVKSVSDLLVTSGRKYFAVTRAYLVSDLTRAGIGEVDFGWGKAVYGGPAKGRLDDIPEVVSFYAISKNKKGESGIVVPVSLPAPAMERFVKVLHGMLSGNDDQLFSNKTSTRVMSSL